MKITLIRHGATKGNIEKRYIGRTDEELSGEGISFLEKMAKAGKYPPSTEIDALFSSPMKRCVQSAEIIFSSAENSGSIVIDDFKEIDFGSFEGRTYKELKDENSYLKWLETGGKAAPPGGENMEGFSKRTIRGFFNMIEQAEKKSAQNIAAVVHGGTIMAVMSFLTGREYYSFQPGNGEGFSFLAENIYSSERTISAVAMITAQADAGSCEK